MAFVRTYDGTLAFTSGNCIAVSDIRSPDAFGIISLPPGPDTKTCTTQEEEGEGDGRSHVSGSGSGSVNRCLACAFSGRGRFFALCDDLKRLHVFSTQSRPWTLLSSRMMVRRATSLTFTLDEASVLVSDKSGDVYTFPTLRPPPTGNEDGEAEVMAESGEVKAESGEVKAESGEVKDDSGVKAEGSEGKTEGRLVLGHLSMVLDLCLAQSDRYVVTGDRDEKIRISHYPNGYNIHTFCLGHTQFVNCLLYDQQQGVLISASGDGSLALWDMQGKQLCRAWLPEAATTAPVASRPQIPVSQPPPPSRPGDMETEEGEGGGEKEEEGGEEKEEREKEEGQGRRAVRRLVFSEKYRLLFVLCYGQPRVEVYQLGTEGGGKERKEEEERGGGGDNSTPTPTLTHHHTLTLPHPHPAPWDLAWDDRQGLLWIVSPLKDAPLAVFRLRRREEGGGREDDVQELREVKAGDPEADSDLDLVLDTVTSVNSHWTFFCDSMGTSDELGGLWKSINQDNVLQYQQRKQQRLQAQGTSHPRHHHHKRGKKGKKGETGSSSSSLSAGCHQEPSTAPSDQEVSPSAAKKVCLSSAQS